MNRFEERLTARTAKKEQNWFLRGWEYQASADGKKKHLVYTGEYYKLAVPPGRRGHVKLLAAVLCLAMIGVYLGFETTMTQGGLVWYAGAPCLLAILPMFYLTLGAVNYVLSEPYFTYRRMYAAFTRLRIGGALTCLLLGMGALGQLVFLLIYGRALRLGPELFMLFGAVFCALCAAGLALLRKNAGCEEVSPREYPGEKGRKTI